MTTILSIQSHVAYGHVGNSASVFPMQRLGVEVWPVHTVNFSNHTGYGEWRGPLVAPDDVRDVITGIGERGAFPEVDAVLSGYQGGEGIGATILEAVAAVKAGAVDYLPKPADADAIEAALLQSGESPPPPPENPMSADRVRWEHIQRVYELCGHNVSETARRLNMHRRTLQRILAKRAPR